MKKFKYEKTWDELEKMIRNTISVGDEITIYKRSDCDDEYYVLTGSIKVCGMPAHIYNYKNEYSVYNFDFDKDYFSNYTDDDIVDFIFDELHQ